MTSGSRVHGNPSRITSDVCSDPTPLRHTVSGYDVIGGDGSIPGGSEMPNVASGYAYPSRNPLPLSRPSRTHQYYSQAPVEYSTDVPIIDPSTEYYDPKTLNAVPYAQEQPAYYYHQHPFRPTLGWQQNKNEQASGSRDAHRPISVQTNNGASLSRSELTRSNCSMDFSQ